ncbi:hypothetical protein [Janthinobacterium fluminis]|uniref:DUF2946 domain-containing protein n=1 Tax=Janthinobacterium fluminis TaxID=2987524 RepID=A0ABT5K1A2_9BURK|nr:hypothetical protein [Janthinobacterium fluminis]MDC8758188.1 hypothetical protein [Janthinobacterium fluminis]
MNRIVARFLLWCLFAALPLQGFAAAIRMSGGHTPPPALQLHGAQLQQHMPAHSHADAAPAHHHDDASCSACSACCVGACAPPVWPMLPAIPFISSEVRLTPAPLLAGHIPEGLERPPRHAPA